MDANGTRFQLLLGIDDWGACSVEGQSGTLADVWRGVPAGELQSRLGWDGTRSELTLPAQVFEFPAARKHVGPRLENRRGADSDAYDNWYWIDDTETSVLIKSSGSTNITTFWSTGGAIDSALANRSGPGQFGPCEPEAAPPETLRGLAVTPDH
jgi:hypothetical protein